MKLGLIARADVARGIAIQSKNFYDHMPVDRTLLVEMPRRDCDVATDWYDNATPLPYNQNEHQLPEAEVREWLSGLDVVFTVETPNDWRMPTWCRQMGVRLVVQGNPEFVRHGVDQTIPHPIWWWPTSWRLSELPPGRVMPVPMPDVPRVAADPTEGPLKILHVIGKRAWADRNGTDDFISAIARMTQPAEVTIHTIDLALPDLPRLNHVRWIPRLEAVEDRWSMYVAQHVLVIPRRYGGLCLPALEASASGLAVVMPDASPNRELATTFFPVSQPVRSIRMACGPVPEIPIDAGALARTLDHLALNRGVLRDAQDFGHEVVPRWSTGWRDEYIAGLEGAHW